jgi:hypothetical protein
MLFYISILIAILLLGRLSSQTHEAAGDHYSVLHNERGCVVLLFLFPLCPGSRYAWSEMHCSDDGMVGFVVWICSLDLLFGFVVWIVLEFVCICYLDFVWILLCI